MSELIVVTFKDQHRAEEVRIDLLRMDSEHLVDLEDAVILSRDQQGEVRLHHATHLTVEGALGGGFLGLIFGVMFLNPVFAALGLAAGAAIGAASGSMKHLGISEDFMKELAGHLQPGTSALCVLVREHLDRLLAELQKFEGRVLRASLNQEDAEEMLKDALDKARETA